MYWVWYLVCRHCWYKDQSIQCIECYVCWHCRYKDQSIQCIECYVCRHCQYKVVWVENLQYRIKGIHPNQMSTMSIQRRFIRYLKCSTQNVLLKREWRNEGFVDTVDTKQVHPVFEMFYSKEREISGMKVLSTLSIQRSKHTMHWMLCLSTLSIEGGLSRKSSKPDQRNPSKSNVDTVDTKQVHPVFEMFYSKEQKISGKQVHPVFEIFYSKEREISRMKVLSTLSIQRRFIRYSKCSTRKREKYERKVIRNEGFVDTVDTKQVHPVFKIYMSLLLIVFTVYVDTVDTYNWITMQILIQRLRITVKFDLNPWFSLNYNRVRIKTSN